MSATLPLISADPHVGAAPGAYRAFVEPVHRPAFDRWASGVTAPGVDAHEVLQALDSSGIAGALLFPAHELGEPPLGALDSPTPFSPELQLVGARAYNRWLATLCAQRPDRLFGVAILPLQDLQAAKEELAWARSVRMRGVILPTISDQDRQSHQVYSDRFYDPFWSACEEAGLPVHMHPWRSPAIYGAEHGADLLADFEQQQFARRLMTILLQEGVFERHPRLRFVLAHQGCRWVASRLAVLQERMLHPQSAGVGERLSLRPGEYFARNCWISQPQFSRSDCDTRVILGAHKMLWASGAHHETDLSAFTTLPERESRAILGENAARLYNLDLGALRAVASTLRPALVQPATA